MMNSKATTAGARKEALWDGRDFDALSRVERQRYIDRFRDGLHTYFKEADRIVLKGQHLVYWEEWAENELEYPRECSDSVAYVLEAFLELIKKLHKPQD